MIKISHEFPHQGMVNLNYKPTLTKIYKNKHYQIHYTILIHTVFLPINTENYNISSLTRYQLLISAQEKAMHAHNIARNEVNSSERNQINWQDLFLWEIPQGSPL